MLVFNLTAAVLVLLSGMAGGALAHRFANTSKDLASLANTFAGGIFLGAALLHMLPDAIANFSEFAPDTTYPVFALVVAMGFLMVLLLDRVMVPSHKGLTGTGAIYPYILMLTLSIHSIITGVALGLEDKVVSATAILIAVLAHKSTAAMALALSFEREQIPRRRTRKLLLIFYTTTPIGILLGTWWSTALEGPAEAKFEGIFDALAAGTFFYIAVMDLFAPEFANHKKLWLRWMMALTGLVVMAIVAIWT